MIFKRIHFYYIIYNSISFNIFLNFCFTFLKFQILIHLKYFKFFNILIQRRFFFFYSFSLSLVCL